MDRQTVDVFPSLVRGHDHAPNPVPERSSHDGDTIFSPDGYRFAIPVHLEVTRHWRANIPIHVGEFLVEDLFERPVRRKEPVALQDRLDPSLHHLTLGSPVVETAPLGRSVRRSEKEDCDDRE